jgi:DNA-binding transcriptional MerR regulator
MKMSDKEQEEYLMQNAAKKTGFSVEDIKRMEHMSDKELEALWTNAEQKGTPEVQKYNQAKQLFDNQCNAEREKSKEQMRNVYVQKYRNLLKTAENEMANCNSSENPACFWQAYGKWTVAQENYKLECYTIWRNQILKEQEKYRQMYKTNNPQNENIIFSDYMTITMTVFDLPEMEWLYE